MGWGPVSQGGVRLSRARARALFFLSSTLLTHLVRKLARLLVDLGRQLARGGQDEGERVRFAGAAGGLHARAQNVGDNRKAKRGGFAGTSLRARHQITPRQPNRDGVPLHGGRLGVLAPFHVLHQGGAEVDVVKRGDGVGARFARRFHGDVFVRLKVDARVLAAKQGVDFGLVAGVGFKGVVVAECVEVGWCECPRAVGSVFFSAAADSPKRSPVPRALGGRRPPHPTPARAAGWVGHAVSACRRWGGG